MQNENTKVDPSEAPEGFIAVASSGKYCYGCYYWISMYNCPEDVHCLANHRKDTSNVIFLKKEPNKATISYPCGSLGEEIEN